MSLRERLLQVFILGTMTIVTLSFIYWTGRTAGIASVKLEAVAAAARADSLTFLLDHAIEQLRVDTVRVDSIVTKWRTARALPPETLPGRVDTLRLPALIAQADTTITALDRSRRQCLSVLGNCRALVDSANRVAAREVGLRYAAEAAQQQASKYRTIERTLCAVSVGANIFQWKAR
mgnify:CR=1 FL=1